MGRLFMANRTVRQLRVFTMTNGIPSLPFILPNSQLTHAGQGVLHPNGFYLVSDKVLFVQSLSKGSRSKCAKLLPCKGRDHGFESGVSCRSLNLQPTENQHEHSKYLPTATHSDRRDVVCHNSILISYCARPWAVSFWSGLIRFL